MCSIVAKTPSIGSVSSSESWCSLLHLDRSIEHGLKAISVRNPLISVFRCQDYTTIRTQLIPIHQDVISPPRNNYLALQINNRFINNTLLFCVVRSTVDFSRDKHLQRYKWFSFKYGYSSRNDVWITYGTNLYGVFGHIYCQYLYIETKAYVSPVPIWNKIIKIDSMLLCEHSVAKIVSSKNINISISTLT